MAAVALTVYQGLAGGHNGRALAGARALGSGLEAIEPLLERLAAG